MSLSKNFWPIRKLLSFVINFAISGLVARSGESEEWDIKIGFDHEVSGPLSAAGHFPDASIHGVAK